MEYFEFVAVALGGPGEYIAILSMNLSPLLNDNVSILTMMRRICCCQMRKVYQDFKAGKRIGSGLASIIEGILVGILCVPLHFCLLSCEPNVSVAGQFITHLKYSLIYTTKDAAQYFRMPYNSSSSSSY